VYKDIWIISAMLLFSAKRISISQRISPIRYKNKF
jgi:hypothetical protein